MRKVLPPLAAFLLVRALLAAAAVHAGYRPFDAASWKRWDSGQYLSIALRGYDLVECARIGYAPSGWCGNAGWMPGYPAVLGLLARMGIAPLTAGAAISAAFEILLLGLAWRMLRERNFLALLACALAPSQVYHHAIFPISMCAFFMLLSLKLLLSERWSEAGASGALAALSYSTGFLLGPIAGAYAASRPGDVRLRARRAALAGGIAALGLAAVFALHHFTLGAWDAFIRVQAKYGHGLHWPFATFADALRAGTVPAAQSIAVAAGMIALATWRIARGLTARDGLLLGTAAAYWLFPLVAGGVSLYRADSLLVPAVLLLGDAPLAVNATVCAGLAALAFPMAQLFYRGILI